MLLKIMKSYVDSFKYIITELYEVLCLKESLYKSMTVCEETVPSEHLFSVYVIFKQTL